MSGEQHSRAEALLTSVSGLLDDLIALEQSYRATREQKTSDLASCLQSLVETADTLALRAHVLRQLYWFKRVPVRQIARAFGLKQGEVRTIAGPMLLKLPCHRVTCQNDATLRFTSLSELTAFEKRAEEAGGRNLAVCAECDERDRRAEEDERRRREAESRREAEEQRRRAESLATLRWPEFIETPEWVESRNLAIDKAGYMCELCEAREVSLYVYLHKNAPQYDTDMWFSLRHHLHVLCAGCVGRCEGLLEEQKYELVKKEFLDHVRSWVRENYPGDY